MHPFSGQTPAVQCAKRMSVSAFLIPSPSGEGQGEGATRSEKRKTAEGMVSVLANPSPQPSPKGRGRLEDSEARLATAVRKFRNLNVGIVFRSPRSSPHVCDDD